MAQIPQENHAAHSRYEEAYPHPMVKGTKPSFDISQSLTASFLYSEKDEDFRDELSAYLKLLEAENSWLRLKYYAMERLSQFDLRKLLDNSDLFLLAASTDFMAATLEQGGMFRRIMDHHQTGKVMAIALLFRKCRIRECVFKNAILLPQSQDPVNSPAWPTRDHAYLDIHDALKPLLVEALEKKTALEKSWKAAQAIHKVESYWAFLQKYPRSRYSPKAKKYLDELVEKELWAKAERQDDVPGYFHYLSNAPMQEKRFEAAQRISEIEDDDEKNWVEAEKNDAFELFLRYRANFPEGKHLNEDEAALNRKLTTPGALEGNCKESLESNFLMYLACRRLNFNEMFSLQSYLKYGNKLKEQRVGVLNNIYWNIFKLVAAPLLALVLFLYLGFPVLKLSGIPEGSTSQFLRGVFRAALVGVLVYGIVLVIKSFVNDFLILKDADGILKRGLVLLKVAYLNNEMDKIQKLLVRLHKVEQVLEKLQAKGALSYLWATNFTEALSKEGQRFVA